MGGQAVANFGSVARYEDAQKMVADAISNFGQLDGVINNAGILRDRMFHKMSLEEWHAVIDVHLNGSFYVSRAAADHFRERNTGAYVHMTSTSGLIGNFGQANYAAAKLGIAALSKSIALDLGRNGVRSNCIAPFAWTRMIGTIPITSTSSRQGAVPSGVVTSRSCVASSNSFESRSAPCGHASAQRPQKTHRASVSVQVQPPSGAGSTAIAVAGHARAQAASSRATWLPSPCRTAIRSCWGR